MINLGLARISRLLRFLAQENCQPQYKPSWDVIHIAGTNGKGSVAAYLSSLLRRTGQVRIDKDTSCVDLAFRDDVDVSTKGPDRPNGKERGIKVGRFTSPHFIDSWDCITINDEAVSHESFESSKSRIVQVARRVETQLLDESGIARGHYQHESQIDSSYQKAGQAIEAAPPTEQALKNARPTQFELLTATAFDLFSNTNHGPCDMAVIECGLGGRLDATNALPTSAIRVSIITRIGLDHLSILGGNLQGIVQEKCGILRRDVPVVVDGDNDRDVLEMIRAEIVRKFDERWANEMLYEARGHDVKKLIAAIAPDVKSCSSISESSGRRSFLLDLMPHQQSNLAIALKAYHILKARYTSLQGRLEFSMPSTSLLEAVLEDASKSYPGRLQWLRPGWLGDPLGLQLPRLSSVSILLDGAHNTQSALVLRSCVSRELTRSNFNAVSPSAMSGDLNSFTSMATKTNHYIAPQEVLDSASSSPTTKSAKANRTEGARDLPPQKVIWILAMSSGKDISEILQTLIKSPFDEIIFTTFGPVDGMPWVQPTELDSLINLAETLDLQNNIKATEANIADALDAAETLLTKYEHEGERPIVVVAGSLYLVSDFLRLVRDGREGFMKHWDESTSWNGS
ncbi:folylpolyglutamate synthase [Neophaeococcomyces mojaviensis]|uniref:Folylpolyglutamate synthase n=1 Tax=Neophaeococcomyces mojaviensis TaxID=3383035 RepID=A0ACC3A692_9EURO|nr:folylpolyglutamate synthase [Knufia sp. JES_112]